jgi:hypothetical protein
VTQCGLVRECHLQGRRQRQHLLRKLATVYQMKVSYTKSGDRSGSACCLLVSFRTYFSTVYYRRTKWSYIAEYRSLLEDLPKHLLPKIQFSNEILVVSFFSFLGWGETVPTWYVGQCLACWTTSGWNTMMNVEQWVEWELAGETEVLGGNLP